MKTKLLLGCALAAISQFSFAQEITQDSTAQAPRDSAMMAPQPKPAAAVPRADSAGARAIKWNVYPVAYYTPETQFGFGVKLINVRQSEGHLPTDRPDSYSPTVIYTTRKQILTSFSADVWRKNNAQHYSGLVEYNDYPYFFFGLGNEAEEEAEEDYTSRTVNVNAQFEQKIAQRWFLGARYEFKNEKIPKVKPGGLLAAKDILGSEGVIASGIGPTLSYDSRENLFTPSKGAYHQFSALFFQKFLGSDYSFSRYKIDLRKYMSGLGPGVLAVQGIFTFTYGDTPFQYLSPLGGVNVMRGLLEGRFRDENAVVAQADYRFPIAGRIGGAVFGGAGQVAESTKDVSFNQLHLTAGGGLRYKLNKEGMVVRGDVAFSNQGMYIYFAFAEAF